MTVSEFVKPEREANRDRNADESENSNKRGESFCFLREEENHVSAYSQLRHLERHRNDDANHDPDDENCGPDFAQTRRRQSAFQPADPIGINWPSFEKGRAHGIISAADL